MQFRGKSALFKKLCPAYPAGASGVFDTHREAIDRAR